jgi:hypothetical protein
MCVPEMRRSTKQYWHPKTLLLSSMLAFVLDLRVYDTLNSLYFVRARNSDEIARLFLAITGQ